MATVFWVIFKTKFVSKCQMVTVETIPYENPISFHN